MGLARLWVVDCLLLPQHVDCIIGLRLHTPLFTKMIPKTCSPTFSFLFATPRVIQSQLVSACCVVPGDRLHSFNGNSERAIVEATARHEIS